MLRQSRAFAQTMSFARHFLLALMVTVVTLLLFPRTFMENDDIGFIYLLSHGLYAPWISKSFCWLLFHLYGLWPGLGWYGLLHYLILMVNLSILLKLSAQWGKDQQLSARSQWGLTLAVILLFYPFFLKITFTSTSILSLGLGLMGLLTCIQSREQGQRTFTTVNTNAPERSQQNDLSIFGSWLWPVLGFGSLFSVGYLVRPEAMGTMIFFLPALMYSLSSAPKMVFSRQGLVSGFIFLLPLFTWLILDRCILHYPAAQAPYLRYVVESNNSFGFAFTELFKLHPEWLAPLGWTRDDFGMLERFLYWDDNVFSQAHITGLMQHLPQALTLRVQDVFSSPALFAKCILRTLQKTWLSNFPFTIYCSGLYFLFSRMGTSRKARYFPLFALAVVFIESVLMQAVLRFPYRVAYPVITMSTLSLMALPGFSVQQLRKTTGEFKLTARISLLLIGLSLLIFNGPVRIWKTATAPIAQSREMLSAFNQFQQTHYILRESSVIPVSAFDPLVPLPLTAPDIGPGWLIHSLPYYARLKQFGIAEGSALIPGSFNNPYILYFFKDQNIPLLQNFIWQHYHRKAEFIQVQPLWLSDLHKNRHLYRLVSPPSLTGPEVGPTAHYKRFKR